jgi:transcriptional activator SPT8
MHDRRSQFYQQWDLNTGQIVRKFTAHGAQLVGIAVRPAISGYGGANISTAKTLSDTSGTVHFRPADSMQVPTSESASGESGAAVGNIARTQLDVMSGQVANNTQQAPDSDAKSEMSYDPLFDEPDADGEPDVENNGQWQQTYGLNFSSSQSGPSTLVMPSQSTSQLGSRAPISSVAVPKNAPPLLDSTSYSTFSSDVLMTASIDGQIILWDKRVNTPRKGVGRLEMSEKTPPWCVSVCLIVVTDQ